MQARACSVESNCREEQQASARNSDERETKSISGNVPHEITSVSEFTSAEVGSVRESSRMSTSTNTLFRESTCALIGRISELAKQSCAINHVGSRRKNHLLYFSKMNDHSF